MTRNSGAYKPKKGQKKNYEGIKGKYSSTDNVARWAAHLVGVLKKSDIKRLIEILSENHE